MIRQEPIGSSTSALRRRVTDAMDGTREIVLDLAELSFIDSMGVRTIALLANRLDGCSLVIRYPQDAVTRLLELLEVDEMPGIQIEPGG
jgi:anti-anti-sigma factor